MILVNSPPPKFRKITQIFIKKIPRKPPPLFFWSKVYLLGWPAFSRGQETQTPPPLAQEKLINKNNKIPG
jgi:hypothetical protein